MPLAVPLTLPQGHTAAVSGIGGRFVGFASVSFDAVELYSRIESRGPADERERIGEMYKMDACRSGKKCRRKAVRLSASAVAECLDED